MIVIFHCRGDLLAEMIETGLSAVDSNGGVVEVTYRGIELAVGFLSSRPRPRGFGGRGRMEHVGMDEGYAPGVSLENPI